MPIVNILKRASSYILGSDDDAEDGSGTELVYEDNEILFCKNNICVHPPAVVRQESDILHYPGYLTVTTKTFIDQYNNAKRPTLFLTWIPNSTLRKCPSTVENVGLGRAVGNGMGLSESKLKLHLQHHQQQQQQLLLQPSPKENGHASQPAKTANNGQEKVAVGENPFTTTNKIANTNPFLEPYNESIAQSATSDSKSMNCSDYSETISISSSSDKASLCNSNDYDAEEEEEDDVDEGCVISHSGVPGDELGADDQEELKTELQPLLEADGGGSKLSLPSLSSQSSVTSVNITIASPHIQNLDLSPQEAAMPPTERFLRSLSVTSSDENNPNWMSPELLAYKHNLAFPESASASPIVSRKAPPLKCRRFSVDLSQMRALRLFFNDEQCTSGQLVIASRESQYKILHFHHGGLDHLAQVLHQWHCLLHNIKLAPATVGDERTPPPANMPYRQFMVCRPEVRQAELHPEEGKVCRITTDYFYGTLLNEKGQIEDDLQLRKCVFFGGLDRGLRKTVWPFLLHCYSTGSTFEDRAALGEIRRQEYEEITRRRLYSMSPEAQAQFWRTVQCVIEKDVVRTDRGNPFFAGDDNPNIDTMKNILLNYAFYNPGMSYTQGMSDLLAPVLCEIKSESETFWCFVGLMQRAIFVCTPTDNDIDRNLCYLRELIRLMVPNFYKHLQKHADAMELLFCHRWILLCFKREFTEAVAIRMWEACWSNYLTDYFHLFLCLAIIAVYADDVIAQDLRTDEMLLHFSSLAMYMDGQLILRKARGLLHQFRQYPKIPCTLSGLCKRCGPGMWDSGHHPSIECVGHLDHETCALAMD
ncbi:TBC1 domain family member 16 isoform X2 [Anopheles ziemanni]|uniref:TBC1 domain family member 16 isoform X2 n=1 Tax=Anopheles coustani TaxID=139045 RepID=UPI002657F87C|nr:TBC1 domain family member 16 isoform X2 [Anopheles coustani]XP_058173427.1 TBC1 domain family member 16 isoform X2 [Anopheles ziemanni]